MYVCILHYMYIYIYVRVYTNTYIYIYTFILFINASRLGLAVAQAAHSGLLDVRAFLTGPRTGLSSQSPKPSFV